MNEKNMMEAFRIYTKLNTYGQILREDAKAYADEEVRGILAEFADETDCAVISAGDYLYLIPLTVHSDYHLSNVEIKRDYLPSRATNMDIYLMYLAVIIFIGEFYDSYQSNDPTRDFLTLDDWMESLDQRLMALKGIDEASLIELEQEYEYNWIKLIEHWESIDIIKETVKKQTARTQSRKSFMNIAKDFLIKEGLAQEVCFEELALTEKAKVIVQRFFMDYEYNRGILDVIYEYTSLEEYKSQASPMEMQAPEASAEPEIINVMNEETLEEELPNYTIDDFFDRYNSNEGGGE